jgi:hypothetical protein
MFVHLGPFLTIQLHHFVTIVNLDTLQLEKPRFNVKAVVVVNTLAVVVLQSAFRVTLVISLLPLDQLPVKLVPLVILPLLLDKLNVLNAKLVLMRVLKLLQYVLNVALESFKLQQVNLHVIAVLPVNIKIQLHKYHVFHVKLVLFLTTLV